MAEELIREIISPEAFGQVERLNKELQANVDLFLKSLAAAKGLDAQFRGANGMQAFEGVLNELVNAQMKLAETAGGVTRTQRKLTEEQAKAAEAVKAHNKEMREQARISLGLDGEYKKLVKQLDDLRMKYKNLAAAGKEQTDEAKAQLAAIQALDSKLKQIDASTGQFTRNVGNYKGELYSFSQVLREAPAFANSLQTGLLGISNNVPMLADEIKKLRGEGKSWTDVFKIMGSSLTSFGGVVTIAITALTFLPSILKAAGGEAEKTTQKIKTMSEVQATAIKNTTDERIELEALLAVAKDENKTKAERSAAIKKINDIVPDYLGNIDQEGIKTGKADGIIKEYINTLQKKALAQAYIAKLTELNNKMLDAESSTIADNVEWYNYLWNAIRSGTNITKAAARNIQDGIANREKNIKTIKGEIDALQTRFNEDLKNGKAVLDLDKTLNDGKKKGRNLTEANAKAEYDILKALLQQQRDIAKERADNEKLDYASRLVALQQYQDASRKMVELEAAYESSKKGLTKKELERIEIEKQVSLNAITRQGLAERSKLYDEMLKQEQKQIDDWNKEFEAKEDEANKRKVLLRQRLVEDAQGIYQKFNNNLDTIYAADLQKLTDSLQNQQITLEDYKKKKEALDLEYQTNKIGNDIEMYKTIIDNLKGQGYDVAEFEKQLTDAIVKQQDLRAKNAEKNTQKTSKLEEEKVKRIKELQKQLTGELLGLGEALFTAQFEREKNALRDQMDGIEKRKAAEIESVNASTLSQQEKADRIKIIEARAQAEKEGIERRNRQIAQEQARFARAFQIANIIANTAQAVVGALAPPPIGLGPVAGIPVAALIGAIGAAQIAKILATPIPRYAVGTEDHPGGLAIVGEKGTEKVIFPDGSEAYTPSKTTLTYLPEHTKVVPNHKLLMEEVRNGFVSRSMQVPRFSDAQNTQMSLIASKLDKLDKVVAAIQGKDTVIINQTYKGVEVSMRKNNAYQTWVNRIKQ